MIYEIHLYAPKTGRLTPSMLRWLIEQGADPAQPEAFWPVRRIKPYALARLLLKLDRTLIPEQGARGDVLLHYPMRDLGLSLHVHERGVIIRFPLVGSLLARIVLGICYTYIRFLYDQGGFWSYDPQINVLSYADDYQSIEETAALMDELLPKLLTRD
jgi:hypothetical protein